MLLRLAGAARLYSVVRVVTPALLAAPRAGASARRRMLQAPPAAAQQAASAPTQAGAAAQPSGGNGGGAPRGAREVVLEFYERYNAGNVDGVLALMAEDCAYHDTVYPEPFRGRKAIRRFFDKVAELVPGDVKFVVEDITEGDPRRAGVSWHVEVEGHEFPFSRGVSFYTVDQAGRITSVRDCVEPALKPGNAALQGLAAVAPLVRKLGPRADASVLQRVPWQAAAMWAFYGAYIWYVMLSTLAPGDPVWRMSLDPIIQVLHESANFFYVNPLLNWLGFPLALPPFPEHPVSEAVFNFCIAWAMMFWPLMVADPNGDRVKNRFPLWVGNMFLTNVFFVPYMAQRLRPDPRMSPEDRMLGPETSKPLPRYARIFGAVGAVVGAVSIGWALAARPEFGGLAERAQYFGHEYASNRVFFAFILDAVLYTEFQSVLMVGAPPAARLIPFFGMAWWLLTGKTGDSGSSQEEGSARDAKRA